LRKSIILCFMSVGIHIIPVKGCLINSNSGITSNTCMYTVEQVLEVLNIQPNVTAIRTDASMLLRYDEMLDKLYNKLDTGSHYPK
jgi:hypothetical protein